MFKKKKAKETIKQQEETATIPEIEEKPEETIPQAKLLTEMTEPERFAHLYSESVKTNELLVELLEIAREE